MHASEPAVGVFASFKRVVEDLTSAIGDLIRSEIRLAKGELGREAHRLAALLYRGIAMAAAGAILGVMAVGFALLAVVYGLALVLPMWAASLIVGAVAGLGGLILVRAGWKRIASADLKPDQTIESVKENVVWLKSRLS